MEYDMLSLGNLLILFVKVKAYENIGFINRETLPSYENCKEMVFCHLH